MSSRSRFPLAILLFYGGTERLRYLDPFPRENLLLVSDSARVVDFLQYAFGVVAYGVLGTTFVVLVLRKFVRASPRARRVYLPLLVAALAAALWAVLNGILTFATAPPEIVHDLFWWQIASLIALPLAMLWGLLRARLARVHVGELVVHLEETPVDGLRDELAVALEDPTLELGLWIPDRGIYVDAAGGELAGAGGRGGAGSHADRARGRATRGPRPRSDAAGGTEARRGRCCRGPARARQRSPARRGARAARDGAGVAGANRRRRGRGAPTDRARSARRSAAAARRARARAAQRAAAARGSGDPELEGLLASTADELQVAVEELRDLAQGIHPGILTQGGLAHALEALAARAPLPVTVDATPERFSPEVESTAYFVACEALTNVVKHADASKASIDARRDNGHLVIEVADDGVGGAEQNGGSGLRGLSDRVEARGGSLVVESVPGSGTRVRGELPCAS